jgi:hypothetical protein
MSSDASTAVWEFSDAPNMTVMMVALVLADHANRDGQVWLSVASVATQARVARSTAYEAMHVLERLGELERVHQGGGGPGDTNIYRLTLVDNLAKKGPGAGPIEGSEKGPKRVRKGSGLSGTKHRSLDPYTNTRARAKQNAPSPADSPAPDPAEIATAVGELRAALTRRPPPPALFALEGGGAGEQPGSTPPPDRRPPPPRPDPAP